MSRALRPLPVVAAIAFLSLTGRDSASISAARAHDLGRFAQTWPVIEPDLLTMIDQRLRAAQRSGMVDRLDRAFAARVEAQVRRPDAVAGMSRATQSRRWTFDPAVTIDADLHDASGKLIAAKGTRVDPLVLVHLPRALLFIDGDNGAEVDWARAQGDDLHAAIVLVHGAPFAMMKALRRRVWFDQGGRLTARFGILHTPARLSQRGDKLVVEEMALPAGARS